MAENPDPAAAAKKSSFRNVFYVGMLSFFGGISQDVFVPILPLYLTNVLGFDKAFLGAVEGLAAASASIFKIVSGYLSDRFRKNKALIFAGYFLSMVSRPLLAVFTGGAAIAGLRLADGIGKGIKDSPKDVIISHSTEASNRGRGFGVARALDTFGSVAGPLLLFLFLDLWKNEPLKYHYILYLTAVPLVATLCILAWKVRDVPDLPRSAAPVPAAPLPSRFYFFLAIMAVFALGNSSDAFLILRAQNVGVTLLAIPLVYALFNAVYALASVPLGSLSDRIGRERVILLGLLAYALAYLGFGAADRDWQIWPLFAFYGIYYATTQGVAKALIADLVPGERRGRAYGIYNSLLAVLALPASLIAGELWDRAGAAAPFLFGSAVATFAVLLLLIFISDVEREK